jgi:uncharacterized protein
VSFAIDANILIYASDRDSVHWRSAVRLLEACAGKREIFYLPWPALMAYLRIATHPAIFSFPLTPAEAIENIQSLLSVPHARVLSEGPRFWEVYRALTKDLAVRGNLVPDAHIAALLVEHGVREILTNDADFRKFPSIRVRNPFKDRPDQ